MARSKQLAVEVRYFPLPANELEERRARLRALLLRGARRVIGQQHLTIPAPAEADLAELLRK